MYMSTAVPISIAIALSTLIVMVGLYEITKVQEMVRHCSYNIMVSPEERLGEMMIYCDHGHEYKIYKEVTSEV